MDGKWPIFIEDEEGGRQQIDFLQIRKGAATRTVLLQMQGSGICKIEIGEAGYLIEGTLGAAKRRTKETERQQMIHAAAIELKDKENDAARQSQSESSEIRERNVGDPEAENNYAKTGDPEKNSIYAERDEVREGKTYAGTDEPQEGKAYGEKVESETEFAVAKEGMDETVTIEKPEEKPAMAEPEEKSAMAGETVDRNEETAMAEESGKGNMMAEESIEMQGRTAYPREEWEGWLMNIRGEKYVVRKMRITELPRDLQYLTKDSFLLHAFFQHGYILLGRCRENNRILIGVPGRSDCQSELVAKTRGFPWFYPRKTRSPIVVSGFWFRIQE